MKKKKIIITQKDIDDGVRSSFCDCPLALAARRAWRARWSKTVTVRREGVFVGDLTDEELWIAPLTNEMKRFIRNFDEGRRVKPTVAVLEFS